MATPMTKREIESLIEGKSIAKKIHQELTYRDLYKNIDNLWSVLFTTGYALTSIKTGLPQQSCFYFAFPGKENYNAAVFPSEKTASTPFPSAAGQVISKL